MDRLKKDSWKKMLLCNPVVFRFHVNLQLGMSKSPFRSLTVALCERRYSAGNACCCSTVPKNFDTSEEHVPCFALLLHCSGPAGSHLYSICLAATNPHPRYQCLRLFGRYAQFRTWNCRTDVPKVKSGVTDPLDLLDPLLARMLHRLPLSAM